MQAAPGLDHGPDSPEREIRVALVLYGGVSLAVYENGVTRSFFDLVKGNGVFGLLHHVLDSRAVVDVVAGTSAGGINGLLLAAALESGAEFAQTADIWRRSGDLGALLRPVEEADRATSLLSGEYYQRELTRTFETLIRPPHDARPCDFEIDVFVTGTDLRGHVQRYADSLGRSIEDKSHRVVFQLKHRPGRKYLGLGDCTPEDRARRAAEQARILASIARVTSSFPAAFPPFLVEQVDESYRECVAQALGAASGVGNVRAYVDGGVLNNKPFGPARQAVFYRMPRSAVDRRLFYVEPDPQQFPEDDGGTGEPAPLGVVVAALTSIPSHQSIGEDLDEIRRHNTRIRWLRALEEETAASLASDAGSDPGSAETLLVYSRARLDSLAKSLALDIEEPPCAELEFPDRRREALFDALRAELGRVADESTLEHGIDPFDVDFHLRQAFHFLYRCHGRMTGGASLEGDRSRLVAIGRVVKLLKIVRNVLVQTRTCAVGAALESGMTAKDAAASVIRAFRHVLDPAFPAWQQIVAGCRAHPTVDDLCERDTGPLSSGTLGQVFRAAQTTVAQERNALLGLDGGGSSLLETVEAMLATAVAAEADWPAHRARFRRLDQRLFPLEYSSGIHELDEIEFYRISPRDAQRGLSQLDPGSKITGDAIANFAAFFRRDWRSNDILWGRLDGICSILEALLDGKAMERAIRRRAQLAEIMTEQALQSWLPGCPSSRQVVRTAWERFDATRGTQQEAAWQALRDALIEAGQRCAVAEDIERVLADGHFQEVAWGMRRAANGVSAGSSEPILDAAARAMGEADLRQIGKREDLGGWFRGRRMGDEKVWGTDGRVPRNILAEYVASAWLMVWGMVANTFRRDGRRAAFLEKGRFRLILRTPALVAYHLLVMMRRDPLIVPLLVVAASSSLVTIGVVAAVLEKWSALAVAALALLALLVVVGPLSPALFRKRWAGKLLRVLGLVLLVLAAAAVYLTVAP